MKRAVMDYNVTRESFDSLAYCWSDPGNCLRWKSVFILPAWLKTWWQHFGAKAELYLRAIRHGEKIIGIAPLMVNEGKASFIGSTDICDYLDFIVTPGMERHFFSVLLEDLRYNGINHLDLRSLRTDSTALTFLAPLARERNCEVLYHEEGVSVELDLPSTWDEYLAMLDRKQRHEVRRKLRRLWAAGNIDYRCHEVSQEAVADLMNTFLKLFSLSRPEKASFMTVPMASFFRSLAEATAEIGLLRFGIVELDALPTAMIMGFDYNDSMYLYNSAYDPQYSALSVGLLCKVLCLKESIHRGRKRWDFLKGGEPYKYRIGGEEIPLFSCQITIN